ncbi:hypothetical protein [Kitasatospora sp. NPDC050543]|uniref:hypothetical protein n=1 Tax=Kitasatospora sp. NPDC050543 TaxID=3364054 RepID=UPI00379419EC
MTRPTVRARLEPLTSVVTVDGRSLTGVRRATFVAEVGCVPTLTVDLVLREAEVDGEVLLTVPQATAAALVALGWTPPPGQEVPDAAAHD